MGPSRCAPRPFWCVHAGCSAAPRSTKVRVFLSRAKFPACASQPFFAARLELVVRLDTRTPCMRARRCFRRWRQLPFGLSGIAQPGQEPEQVGHPQERSDSATDAQQRHRHGSALSRALGQVLLLESRAVPVASKEGSSDVHAGTYLDRVAGSEEPSPQRHCAASGADCVTCSAEQPRADVRAQ